MSKVRFMGKVEFFHALREKVDSYFVENNIKKTGDYRLYLKTIILFSTLISLYTILVFFTPAQVWVSLLLCGIMGVNFAAIGFNVMHDGAHGSYSDNTRLNDLMGFALNIMGGNMYIWKLKHNVNHHTYTNIEGFDDDIDIRPFIRVNTNQKKYFFHKFQHIYSMLLYGLTYLAWIFLNDFQKYFGSRVADNTPLKTMTTKDHLTFWFSKVFYVSVFIVIPGLVVGWPEMIIGFLTMGFVTGVLIAVVFQLAHVVEDVTFIPSPESEKSDADVATEWAVHQINTTVNFATKSKSLNWLLGGLNFQVEHHLFPRISHVHYPQLNKIVKEVCAEFGVNYREFPTMVRAVRSHLEHLKLVGKAA
jgi:linoleoyl-CoA desaturase